MIIDRIKKKFLPEIYLHFAEADPEEACGIIAVKLGKLQWFPCENIAENKLEFFAFNAKQYIKIARESDIIGIVHSHIGESCEPSEWDIEMCNSLGITYYIFNFPNLDSYVLEPKETITDLYGREYNFGTADCFEAVRDFYKTVDIHLQHRYIFDEKWWEKKDSNYFCDSFIQKFYENCVPVESNFKKYDLLVFNVNSEIPNHCGIYLGEDVFYHHAVNRLSCRENLYPFWKQYITRAYRHERYT